MSTEHVPIGATTGGARMTIVHLDHTTSHGGAELALLRMLRPRPPWEARLMLPRGPRQVNAFEPLFSRPESGVTAVFRGPAQPFGASIARPIALVAFALRIMGQGLAVRTSREFRSADLVHANTSRTAVYGAVAVSLFSTKPLVVHLRDMVDAAGLGKIGFELFRRWVLPRAGGVIANSHATLRSASPYLAQSVPRRVIPSASGIDTTTFTSSRLRQRVGRIGMVARLDPWKGQDLLIHAFADAFPSGDVRLILAGGTPFGNKSFLANMRALAADRGVSDRVEFLGHVDDVGALIDTLDICVQASRRPEPLGQNVVQYLAAGKPVIAADEGGPAEWIDHAENGILFRARDRLALADSLRLLTEDEDLRRRLGEAAAKTQGLMSDAEVTAAHHSFFTDVILSRRRGALGGLS